VYSAASGVGVVSLRRFAIVLLVAGIAAGCASSGPAVVQSGPGLYTLSKEATVGAAGVPKLKAEIMQDANQYCATNGGRDALLVGAREQRGDYMLSVYTAEIDFRCIATQTMRDTTKAAVLECRERRIRQEFKTYRQSVDCSNPKILAAYESSGYPYMDLVRLLLDARMMAAENLDKGAITETVAETQSAELERRLTAEDQKRRAAGAANTPVAASDPGAYLQGLNAFQVAKRAPGKHPPVQRTALACNATGFGGGLSTTSCY